MPPGQRPFCNICRDGGLVTIQDATLATLGGVTVSCGVANEAGLTRMLTLEQCALAQSLAVGTCGCTGEVVPTAAPVLTGMPTPVPTPTPAPVAQPFCNLCGGGGRATFNGIIGAQQCFDVEQMGMNFELDPLECIVAQIAAFSPSDPCRCSGLPTVAPVLPPTEAPTPVPSNAPTPVPTSEPTPVPTPRPSSSPTPLPTTLAPIAAPVTSAPNSVPTAPTDLPTTPPPGTS